MSTVVSGAEQRVVLNGVSWATYESLVTELDSPGKRLIYDRGT